MSTNAYKIEQYIFAHARDMVYMKLERFIYGKACVKSMRYIENFASCTTRLARGHKSVSQGLSSAFHIRMGGALYISGQPF